MTEDAFKYQSPHRDGAGVHTFRQAVRRRVREYRARNVRIQDLCRRPHPALDAVNDLRG